VQPNYASRVWLAAFAAALLLFGLTLAPDVLMMDSGEYQVAVHRFPNLGLGDRPADLVRVHPVYLALAKLISFAPVGNLAFRVNFASALFGAIAVGNAALLAWWFTRNAWTTVLAAAVLTFGHTLWAFAVIAEVMTLIAAAITAELMCWWLYGRTGRTCWLMALALLNGIGVAIHLQLGLSTPIYAGVLVWLCCQRRLPLSSLVAWGVVWLIGTLPYSAIVAYYAMQTHDWSFILGSATYGRFGASPRHFAVRTVLRGLAAMLLNYPTLLILFAGPGLLRLRRIAQPAVFMAFVGVIITQLLFVLTYNVPDQYSFFAPVYAVFAPLIALGASALLIDRMGRVVLLLLALTPVPIYAVAAPALRKAGIRLFHRSVPYRDPYDFFIKPWKCGDRGQRRYVTEVFAALPPDAVLLTSYTMEFMLEYGQRVEGLRPDVLIVDDPTALLAQLMVDANDRATWRRPIFANDVEAKDFPPVLRELCKPRPAGIVWRLEPPWSPDLLRSALNPEPEEAPAPPP